MYTIIAKADGLYTNCHKIRVHLGFSQTNFYSLYVKSWRQEHVLCKLLVNSETSVTVSAWLSVSVRRPCLDNLHFAICSQSKSQHPSYMHMYDLHDYIGGFCFEKEKKYDEDLKRMKRGSDKGNCRPTTRKVFFESLKFCRACTKRNLITSQTRVKRVSRIHWMRMVRWCVRLDRAFDVCLRGDQVLLWSSPAKSQ